MYLCFYISCIVYIFVIFLPLTSVFEISKLFENDTVNPELATIPKAVKKQLAWYGISQAFPLPISSKLARAARLMSAYSLGRPHIIFQAGLPTAKPKLSRKTLIERGLQYYEEENNKNRHLLKFIREGGIGDGYTVRRVKSPWHDKTYIINKGLRYECTDGGRPITEGYTKFELFKCTGDGRKIERVKYNIDVCEGAETAYWIFCEYHGWQMCLGPEGTVPGGSDCGSCRTTFKVQVQAFFDECAIDENVVFWYSYFGEIPKKIKSSQLCQRTYPCILSYMYRREAPWGANTTETSSTNDLCVYKYSNCPFCTTVMDGRSRWDNETTDEEVYLNASIANQTAVYNNSALEEMFPNKSQESFSSKKMYFHSADSRNEDTIDTHDAFISKDDYDHVPGYFFPQN